MSSLLSQARRALLGLTDTEKQLQEHFGSPDRAEVLAQHAQATQAIHARAAAQPPGPLSTGARASEPPAATATDLHCWAKFQLAATKIYSGKFGFDWMDWERHAPLVARKPGYDWQDPLGIRPSTHLTTVMDVPVADFEYCYDKSQQHYVPVAQDDYLKHRLQDEYQRLVVYGEDYFAAWLSMWPGQEITLHLRIEALNSAPAKGDYLTFGAHASYQVTINGQVNQAIRLPLRGGDEGIEITIKCVRACTNTALRVLDEKGVLVGQLNVVDNTKTYHLPIRVIYLVKEGPQAATQVKQLQQSFAALNLENYLNTYALNQALIKAQFEKTNQVYEVLFKEAEWEGEFYDKAKNWLNDYEPVNSKTGYKTGSKISILDRVLAEYSAKYEHQGAAPFRGILLVLSSINKNPAYDITGESNFVPFDYREAMIYKDGISKRFLYAHEIGHTLGLEHSFFDSADGEKSKESYVRVLEASKRANDKLAADYQDAIAKDRLFIEKDDAFYTKHPLERKRAEGFIQEKINKLTALQRTMRGVNRELADARLQLAKYRAGTPVSPANPYKFKKYSTRNIMDYSYETTSYFHWQWLVMQRDVLKYYGK